MACFQIESMKLQPQPHGTTSKAFPVSGAWACVLVTDGTEQQMAADARGEMEPGVGYGSTVAIYLDEGEGALLWDLWRFDGADWIHVYTSQR